MLCVLNNNYPLSLSDAGSIASIISLVATIILALFTRGIRSTVKRMSKFKNYKSDKKEILNSLKGLLDLLSEDNIYDLKYISDSIVVISKLYCYKEFVTWNNRLIIMRINWILKKGINDKNKALLNFLLSKLIGSLDIKQEQIDNV